MKYVPVLLLALVFVLAPLTSHVHAQDNLGSYGTAQVTNPAPTNSGSGSFNNFDPSTGGKGLITWLISGINALVPLVFAVAFIVFLFGVFQTFIAGAANEEKRAEGVKLVTYGIVGFFLMLSVWGLVSLLTNTFGTDKTAAPKYPTLPQP